MNKQNYLKRYLEKSDNHMEKSWESYCKMLKHYITVIANQAVEDDDINRETLYTMHLLTNTAKSLYKLAKYEDKEKYGNGDSVLDIFDDMEEVYKSWKKIKEKEPNNATKSFEKIKHLMDLYEEFMKMVSKMELTEEELQLIKKHINSI